MPGDLDEEADADEVQRVVAQVDARRCDELLEQLARVVVPAGRGERPDECDGPDLQLRVGGRRDLDEVDK